MLDAIAQMPIDQRAAFLLLHKQHKATSALVKATQSLAKTDEQRDKRDIETAYRGLKKIPKITGRLDVTSRSRWTGSV